MHVTALPLEVALIERLARGFARSPLQLNGLHESDAELLRLPAGDAVLALTTDAIAEEIEAGLYADPYLIGWMAVLANASDLAAVGAEPIGILVNETLPRDASPDFLARLQQGIRDAVAAASLPVLGGDTNHGPRTHIGACAVGLIPGGRPLTRRGAAPGDRVLASGPLGLGAAFALDRRVPYRPEPRLREGRLLRRFASCAMDTSDGAITTLDELMRLNGVGFALDRPVDELLHGAALDVARARGLPLWTMLAGPHGEFELVFTVARHRVEDFLAAAASQGWRPLDLGEVVGRPGFTLDGGPPLDTRRIRDLFAAVGGDVERYVEELLRL